MCNQSSMAVIKQGSGQRSEPLINLTPEQFIRIHLKPIKTVNNEEITWKLLSLQSLEGL